MKKNLLVTGLLFISLNTFAQTSIGVKGGLNFASLSNSYSSLYSGYSGITTFNAGVFADFKFGSFSLQPALNYTGEGGTYNEAIYYLFPGGNVAGPNVTDPSSPGSEKIKVQLYYLQLPVNLVYHIPAGIGNFYFGAGPYIAQGLSGKTTSTVGNSTESQKVTFGSAPSDVKAQQFGADAIIGFKFKNGILINANYDLGLSNDIPSSANDGTSKSRVFGISLGYVFL